MWNFFIRMNILIFCVPKRKNQVNSKYHRGMSIRSLMLWTVDTIDYILGYNCRFYDKDLNYFWQMRFLPEANMFAKYSKC